MESAQYEYAVRSETEPPVKKITRFWVIISLISFSVIVIAIGCTQFLSKHHQGRFTRYQFFALFPATDQSMTEPSDLGHGLRAFPLPPIETHLAGHRGQHRIKLGLTIAIPETALKSGKLGRLAAIQFRISELLCQKTIEEVSSQSGKAQLLLEITDLLNRMFGQPLVQETLFSEFITI